MSDLLRHEISIDLDKKFKAQGESLLKSMNKMLEANNSTLDNLMSIRDEIALDLEQVRADVNKLESTDPGLKLDGSSMSHNDDQARGSAAGDGLGFEGDHRGKVHNIYVPPSARGARDPNPSPKFFLPREFSVSDAAESSPFSMHMEMPRFDGTNPRMWQNRCEDQFRLCSVPAHRWISLATTQFEGVAPRWLESVQRRMPNSNWNEFCNAVQSRFDRNQHQTLLHKLFCIAQTSTMEDYVDRFAELYDQLTAYEDSPNALHYTTRFLDALKPGVRIAVALQKSKDLDVAYELALLHEELGEGITPINNFPARRMSLVSSAVTSPKVRTVDDRKGSETVKPTIMRISGLHCMSIYRRSKCLCFVCGERWSKDDVCKSIVQLHFV